MRPSLNASPAERAPAHAPSVPNQPAQPHPPAEGDGAKGVAPLVLEQAGAELGQAAEEEAERHSQLRGGLGLSQLRLGALQQRRGERKAIQAQRGCRQAGQGGGSEGQQRR